MTNEILATQILNLKTQKALCVTDGILLELVAIETKPYRRGGVEREYEGYFGRGLSSRDPRAE